MKKITTKLLLALLITSVFLVGCSNDKKEETPKEEKVKVALVTAVGGLGDRSFNDSAWEGFKRAEEELNVEIKVVEPQSVADYANALKSVASSGFDFVMAVGNDMADALTIMSEQYPDVYFAGVNVDVDAPNVAVARFADHEGSFLVGALASLMSKSGVIGFIGGMDVPAINRFYKGYEEGALYANPDIDILKSLVGTFADPAKGKEFALELNSNDADVIFHAAGKTGEGLFEAVKEIDDLYAIGVDQNQDYIVEGKVLTSMQKKVDNAAYDLIKSTIEDNFESGVKVYGLKEGGVGITEMEFTKDLIPAEVMAKLDEITKGISNGDIKVTDIFENN